jgi:hypothetical protein
MRSRRRTNLPSRIAIALASVAATLGVARVASAQNVTLALSSSQPNPYWLDSKGNLLNGGSPLRGQGNNPYGASFTDCDNDYQMQFSLVVTYPGGTTGQDSLQVWAGTQDCTQAGNRTSTMTGQCVPVTAPVTLSALSLTVPIYIRDIAMAINGAAPGGVGNIASFTSNHATNEAACFRQIGSAAVAIGIYFLAFTDSGATLDTSTTYNAPSSTGAAGTNGISVDFVGPPAPTGGSIGIGDTELVINWAPASDGDTAGFQVLCDPNPNQPTSPDADPSIDAQCSQASDTPIEDSSTGDDSAISDRILTDEAGLLADSGDDSGLDATTLDGSTSLDSGVITSCGIPDFDAAVCSTSPLVDMEGKNGSQIPQFYYCGPQISSTTATTYSPTQLTDGVYYTVAVAGYDLSENVGAVHVIGCSAPEPIRDFWTTYRQDGGGAGGAFCALDNVGAPVSSSLLCVGFGITAFTFVRRRRSRRR